MNKEKAIDILSHFNMWRRGKVDKIKYNPKEIGIAIDRALQELEGEINK